MRDRFREYYGRTAPAAFGTFLVSVVVGFLVLDVAGVTELAGTGSLSPYSQEITFESILINNFVVLFFVLTGAFVLGFTTVLSLLYTGIALGITIRAHLSHLSMTELVFLTAPHGVFEILGLTLGAAVSFRISTLLLDGLLTEGGQAVPRDEVRTHGISVVVSVLLIVLAAWIETTVTPVVA